ncbi:phage tail assembly chaperone [Methylobacterium symbioticum]|uniref:Phage tail assembly chaperone n=1 Tax=Methylobacterium symbioticum TaxID=2584084 RepID=A0A509EEM1_9HYPH|nr:phage tail assembly chaperone [Methylobacterium symbioticum]VUD72580.1 hypothetical protein MET9862_03180 [Methylobacterium symbioticum]
MSAAGGHEGALPRPSAQAVALPWDDLLALCLGRLRWPPATFWAATPREVAAALGRAPAPMSRAELDRLIAAHPD